MVVWCKSCGCERVVKNGLVRDKQRYRCKDCGYNFVEGDERFKAETAIKRAFAVILYSVGKSSYGFIARLFGVTPAAVQKWLKQEADLLDEPEISGDMREMEFDEMWHFIGSKKTKNGSSKQWIMLQAEPLPGLQAVVMLQPSDGSTTRSSI
jgi:transposase-like protein